MILSQSVDTAQLEQACFLCLFTKSFQPLEFNTPRPTYAVYDFQSPCHTGHLPSPLDMLLLVKIICKYDAQNPVWLDEYRIQGIYSPYSPSYTMFLMNANWVYHLQGSCDVFMTVYTTCLQNGLILLISPEYTITQISCLFFFFFHVLLLSCLIHIL